MTKVEVLLSYYHGEKYIEEQIKSIKNQHTNATIELSIRNDGDQDSYLNKFSKLDFISIFEGENIGVKKSFFNLILNSNDSADYFCFCDQDDYWFDNKVARGIDALSKYSDIPALYFSKALQTDKDLVPISLDSFEYGVFSFDRNLIKNNAIGCTMMFNKKLRDILKDSLMEYNYVTDELLHDHITYAVCNGVGGKVIFDPEPTVYYRQHGENVVGNRNNIIKKILANGIFDSECRRLQWAIELRENFKEVFLEENNHLLDSIINYKKSLKKRIELSWNKDFKYKNMIERINIALLFLFKKF